jgi:hypothetical protein
VILVSLFLVLVILQLYRIRVSRFSFFFSRFWRPCKPIGLQERSSDLSVEQLENYRHSEAAIEQSTRLRSTRGKLIKGITLTGTWKMEAFRVLLDMLYISSYKNSMFSSFSKPIMA